MSEEQLKKVLEVIKIQTNLNGIFRVHGLKFKDSMIHSSGMNMIYFDYLRQLNQECLERIKDIEKKLNEIIDSKKHD